MTQQAQSLLVACKRSGQLERVVVGAPTLLAHDATGSLLELIDPADEDAFMRFMRALDERGRAFAWQLRVSQPEGVSPMHFAGVADDAVLWVAASRDPEVIFDLLNRAEREIRLAEWRRPARRNTAAILEELTRVNNELVNLQRQLAQQNAELVGLTVERNQLLGIAAHDMRNPLMVVQSYCELLLSSKGGPLAPDKANFVARVHQAADAMLLLLNDTLDYTKLSSGELKLNAAPTDLTLLVQRQVLDYQPLAERKHIALSFQPPPGPLPAVRLDVAKVERVLLNLLSNAIKYSCEGSAVEVEMTSSLDFAQVSIRDHGEGIAADEVPKLFRPFQTSSTRPTAGEPSTGLGLAIVKKLVEAHGGHVAVSSLRHSGSSFSFELPFEPAAPLTRGPTNDVPGRHHATDSTQHS